LPISNNFHYLPGSSHLLLTVSVRLLSKTPGVPLWLLILKNNTGLKGDQGSEKYIASPNFSGLFQFVTENRDPSSTDFRIYGMERAHLKQQSFWRGVASGSDACRLVWRSITRLTTPVPLNVLSWRCFRNSGRGAFSNAGVT